jgi:glutaredoxin 3
LKTHHYIDVKQVAGKLDEMLKLSNGQRKVPVIVQDGKVTVGFGGY